MKHLKPVSALLACLIGASALSAVTTQAAAAMPEVVVHYADLDLGRPADVALLYQRLRTAAETVCTPVPSYELARFAAYQRCVGAVLEGAVSQVRSPALLALHRASTAREQRGAGRS